MSNFYPGLYDPANAAILSPDGNSILPNSPGLGTSPNPLLSGLKFYLNGLGIAGQNGIPDGLVKNHWAAFGPRLGFAYDLSGSGKTVLRGGFGIMYERIQGNDMYNAGPNQPFSTNVTFNNVSLSNPNTSLLTGQTLTAPITVGEHYWPRLYRLQASSELPIQLRRSARAVARWRALGILRRKL